MKYLIIPLVLILASCSNKGDNSSALKAELRESQFQLQSCQSSLEMYRNSGTQSASPSENEQEETEAPPEPQCEEVEYAELYQEGKILATCKKENVDVNPCGISAGSCGSDYTFECLQNVKIKTITKKVCE